MSPSNPQYTSFKELVVFGKGSFVLKQFYKHIDDEYEREYL